MLLRSLNASECPCCAPSQVMLDAVDLRLLCPRWLRSIIGLVSQEPVLLATDIRGNITLGR